MPNKNLLIDTNVLLDDPKILYKALKTHDKVVIPLTVLKELDKHKFNPDLSYSARTAIYEIVAFREEYPDSLILAMDDDETSTNDLLIIDAAIANKLINIIAKDFFNTIFPFWFIKV